MKKISKHLQEKITEAFNYHKDVDKLFVTEDGNVFLPDAENHAVNHAYKNGIKHFEVKRSEQFEVEASASPLEDMTVKELRALAEERGIELTGKKKAEIIAEIESAAENQEEPTSEEPTTSDN